MAPTDTVNDPGETERLMWLGVDALVTDVPDRARRVLDAPAVAVA
jgi:glycerophosphoryl diester phosphodiesterase